MPNPVRYFEIPVIDMNRAMRFYSAVFGFDFERQEIDGYDMALFPFAAAGPGASGALAKGDVYVPTKHGAILYFDVANLGAALGRARSVGAEVLYAPKDVADGTRVAEIADSEGNRIALIQRNR